MPNALFLFYDGKLLKADKPLISPNNRSFRYGDGFFETMKWCDGNIVLVQHHMERLFNSLALMRFKPPTFFTAAYILNAIEELVKKNQHHHLARIRITVFRGDGGIYDEQNHFPHILIQSWDLNESNNKLNENGLTINLYTSAIKQADHFSMVKSNNYLPYVMAALWAKEQHLNDAVLLNANGNIADATIANIFMVNNGVIKTPAITEGPVAGIMRRYLMEQLRQQQYEVVETVVTREDMAYAQEIFLTNAIYGIRWVKQFGKNSYTTQLAVKLHHDFILPLFK